MSMDQNLDSSADPSERNRTDGLRRRGVLKALVTAPVVAPLIAQSTPQPEALQGVAAESAPVVAAPRRAPWWGWTSSHDLSYWFGPFESREAAEADALRYCESDEGFTTGLCQPLDSDLPDYVDMMVQWLADVDSAELPVFLADAYEGANVDVDYDGEIGEAAAAVDWNSLAAPLMVATEAALDRAGYFLPLPLDAGCLADGEAALSALESDATYRTAVDAIVQAWPPAAELIDASRMIEPQDEVDHNGGADV